MEGEAKGTNAVIPAKAGISAQEVTDLLDETPAFAGVTACWGRQNGFTITSTMIRTANRPGTSFIIRSALPLIERSPRASLRP